MTTPERRSFFRVNSEIVLSFHNVDNDTLLNCQPEDEFPQDQKTLDLFNELHRLDKDASPHLISVGEYNRSLAEYLKILNRKLDLVAQQSLASDYVSKEVRPTHVNLSEGGLAFNCSRSVYKDSNLALRMLFLADYSSVATFARVVRCEPHEDREGFKIACRFHSLSNAKQELLGKHIMHAQMTARRQKQS